MVHLIASLAEGSSPLARGLRFWGCRDSWLTGIIPARAGFTLSPGGRGTLRADHPRSRGVYVVWRLDRLGRSGSSPLARGLPHGRPGAHRVPRIIPARAGFTQPRQGGGRLPGDHPRSRGVYPSFRSFLSDGLGSSPLARGLPAAPSMRGELARIIPARAGFT